MQAAIESPFRTRGKQTLVGYLLATKGPLKKKYGLLGDIIALQLEAEGRVVLPRYADLHAVWSGWDPQQEAGQEYVRPFVRYRRPQPIPGLRSSCRGHRVEITCTVTEAWSNGLGSYITGAKGRCLDCDTGEYVGGTF